MIPHDFSPVFIVGTGRSGTTLMAALLSAHSRIAVPPETHFMKRFREAGDLDAGPTDFEAFWTRLIGWCRFQDLEVNPAQCRREIVSSGDLSFRNIFATILEAFRTNEHKERVGEKTPSHRRFIPTLFDWYPASQVVVMQRDPRAVVASQLKCPWVTVRDRTLRHGIFRETRSSQIAFYAHDWRDTYEKQVPRYIDDPRVMQVRYENLVQQPEPIMREVCRFLNESFEPSMLERRSDAKVAKHSARKASYGENWESWVQQHHRKTQQPISAGSIDKWRSELSAGEVAVIEGICEAQMLEAGYHLETTSAARAAGKVLASVESTCESLEQQARSLARTVLKKSPVPLIPRERRP